MKNYILIALLLVLTISCEKEELNFKGNLTNGFCIVLNDEVILNHNDFEYYDYSSHLIFLKNNSSIDYSAEDFGEFQVYANKKEIYSGQIYPSYSSTLPSGPILQTHPSFYGDNIVSIGLILYLDTLGNFLPDPREDERIVDALKKYDQFRAGLSCEIKSVQYESSTQVKVELLLKNNDAFNYYYIDPEKTGMGLFHYFTNGLFIRNFNTHESYTHKIETVSPDPWNTWEKDWLSVINGNESKVITIVYDNFEEVPNGQYKAFFEFPGLRSQVDRNDISQDNGQIWLGELNMSKEITIE